MNLCLTSHQNYLITKQNEEIYKSLARSLHGGVQALQYRHLMNEQILQLEFAPLINRIISPPLRPVRELLSWEIRTNHCCPGQ